MQASTVLQKYCRTSLAQYLVFTQKMKKQKEINEKKKVIESQMQLELHQQNLPESETV